MARLLLLLLFIGFLGCKEKSDESKSVYFGGEIVNPTDSLVILFKGEQPIDSAQLDAQNRFRFEIDSLQTGLYNFRHQPEFQYVFLEEGDSVQIRLNTVAFDESLVFSGEGEQINNFLIDFFLESEAKEGLIREYYIPLEPEAFEAKLDSLQSRDLRTLEALRSEFPITEAAYHTAYSSIAYQHYLYKEKYPFWHRKLTGDPLLHELPEDFYAYRDEVSYNDPALTSLKPYHDFMIYHIGNLAFMSCQKECAIKNDRVMNQLHFNQHQLQLIDSLVTGEELRDNLFRTVAFDYLLKYDSEHNFNVFMEDFLQVSANNRHLEEIQDLSKSIQRLRPNEQVPDLSVVDVDGKTVTLRQIASEGPVVFYFWSGPQQHHLSNITRRVNELRGDYDSYRFIGICLRTDEARWKSMLNTYSLDKGEQFWAPNYEEFAHTLVVYHPYKCILTKDGRIVDGFGNLNTSY